MLSVLSDEPFVLPHGDRNSLCLQFIFVGDKNDKCIGDTDVHLSFKKYGFPCVRIVCCDTVLIRHLTV